MEQLKDQINAVVEAREKSRIAAEQRRNALQAWQEENQALYDSERESIAVCQEAEAKLRETAIQSYTETGNKAVAPGVGIRLMTRIGYDGKEAFDWAVEHKLALKLDTSSFEKIAKTNDLSFVTITEEPQATIATELARVE